jgi:RecJ-like exonuclease
MRGQVYNKQNKIYNEASNSYIELKNGEEWCPSCHGKGYDIDQHFVCSKCKGQGKLDWITRITSLSQNNEFFIQEKIITQMAEHFKNILDNEILEKLIFNCNKKKKGGIV